MGAEQNTHVCPVCLGTPGVFVVNKRVVEFAKAGLALNCKINKFSNLIEKIIIIQIYPKIPTSSSTTIAEHGYVVEEKQNVFVLLGIHMEIQGVKTVHSGNTIKDSDSSNVTYNRTGVHEMVFKNQICIPHRKLQ